MTNFQKKVLKAVMNIPLGQVRTYKWLAKEIGYPKAYRAVASVLAKNPFPLFVPCHRVVNAKEYGDYMFGRKLKKDLINFEKKIVDMIE